jgi:hypothetical protein
MAEVWELKFKNVMTSSSIDIYCKENKVITQILKYKILLAV